MDIDVLWEYGDPQLSEERFREALGSAEGEERLELLTQIARTFGLRGRFAEAHEMLNGVERELGGAGPKPRVRCQLERGRAFNSAGQPEHARELFTQAWELARQAGLEGLAVDAAHMLAITWSGKPEAIEWNQRGLALARASQDARARGLIPAMLNNTAWDLHSMGHFDEALVLFKEAQAEWSARGGLEQIRIAKWSVGRCLRSLGRYSEALDLQQALEAEHIASGSVDGYVFEELAENLAALGRTAEACAYFAQAAAELSKDEWFIKNEAKRLARLKKLARAFVPGVEEKMTGVDQIYNYRQVDERVSTAGQPNAEQLQAAAREGFETVINLATFNPEYSLEDEAGLVRSLGLRYEHIPVEWERPLVSDFETFERVLKQAGTDRTLVHCAANFRASAFYALYAQKNLGWSESQAETFRNSVWAGSDYPVWEKFIETIRAGFKG